MLQTSYSFRYVQYFVADLAGDLNRAKVLYGTIKFDGKGGYTLSGISFVDSNSASLFPGGLPSSASATGTYSIGACGLGFLSNPLSPGDVIWGTVSAGGIFVGSTTETANAFNDLFVAAPSVAPSLSGAYSVAYLNFPDGLSADNVAVGFQMSPDGRGNQGTL